MLAQTRRQSHQRAVVTKLSITTMHNELTQERSNPPLSSSSRCPKQGEPSIPLFSCITNSTGANSELAIGFRESGRIELKRESRTKRVRMTLESDNENVTGQHNLTTVQIRFSPRPFRSLKRVVDAWATMFPPIGFVESLAKDIPSGLATT